MHKMVCFNYDTISRDYEPCQAPNPSLRPRALRGKQLTLAGLHIIGTSLGCALSKLMMFECIYKSRPGHLDFNRKVDMRNEVPSAWTIPVLVISQSWYLSQYQLNKTLKAPPLERCSRNSVPPNGRFAICTIKLNFWNPYRTAQERHHRRDILVNSPE